MDNKPRHELIDIVKNAALIKQNQQLDILSNTADCNSQLRKCCDDAYSREIEALVEAHRIDVISDLKAVRKKAQEEVKKTLFQLTDKLMKRPIGLNMGDAYWAIDSWAEALGLKVPATKTFTCTWNVEVRGRKETIADDDWKQLLGITPGSVTIPPNYCIRLIPQSMNNECFPIWVQHLELIEEVNYLDLGNQQITDDDLDLLDRFLSLEWLNLSSTEITDKGLSSIAKLNGLKYLYIDNCRWITNEGLEDISKLRTLEGLSLAENSKISNEGLEHLKTIPHLKKLTLRETGVKNAALFALEGMRFLEYLDVSYTDISDSALSSLCVLPRLVELRVTGCGKITDAGIAHLQYVKPLRKLELSETSITDKGINYLRRSGLTELRIWRCWGVTDPALRPLKKKMKVLGP